MENLRPTVKRNLSLFSVQAWQQGYGKYLQDFLGWHYPVYFHYDGEKVNFYHTLADFEHFKNIVTPRLIGDQKLFERSAEHFRDYATRLKDLQAAKETVEEMFMLIGRIMSLYIFIVSDAFVKQVPDAWNLRLLSEGISYEKDKAVEDYIKNLLRQNNLDKNLAHVMNIDEVLALGDGESIPVDQIQSRSNGYIIENTTLLSQNDFEKFCQSRNFVNPELAASNTLEIKGQIAYPGRVTGQVIIVKRMVDVERIAANSIVVCVMTNVNYTSALAKALAIVTDEGGITCHAAIVARELKKPCVIGTKIATQLLKDGDKVDVDADKGIVSILNEIPKPSTSIKKYA
jgi:phosphohistidine swiveling domain-containing protein